MHIRKEIKKRSEKRDTPERDNSRVCFSGTNFQQFEKMGKTLHDFLTLQKVNEEQVALFNASVQR